jgi:hypothetical protein
MSVDLPLAGKRVLVTGGTRGVRVARLHGFAHQPNERASNFNAPPTTSPENHYGDQNR